MTIANKNRQGFMGPEHAKILNGEAPHLLPVYTVTQANALTDKTEGMLVYVSNGNAGAKCLAVYDGANWKVVALGATIS